MRTTDRTIKRNKITRQQAVAITVNYLAEFIDEHPEPGTAEFESLRRRLSWYVEADLDGMALEDTLNALWDSWAAADGSHPDIHRNRARTVDNTHEVRDRCRADLNTAMNFMLSDAGFRGDWLDAVTRMPIVVGRAA